MKVSDLISNWSRKRWARDDGPQTIFAPVDPDDLRLRWFSTPDDEGWFRVIATDSKQRDWSTFCRIDELGRWPVLELTLSRKLQASLAEIGALDLDGNELDRKKFH